MSTSRDGRRVRRLRSVIGRLGVSTWTYLRRRAGHGSAVAFLDTIEVSPRVRVETVDGATQAAALAWLRVRNEREYSFVDAPSFAVMRQRRITDALAFDGDVTAAGFVELR